LFRGTGPWQYWADPQSRFNANPDVIDPLGALTTVLYLGGLAVVPLRAPGLAVHGALLLTLLAAQAALGVANVVARQLLALAVAHNAGAALLLTIVVVLNFTVFPRHDT